MKLTIKQIKNIKLKITVLMVVFFANSISDALQFINVDGLTM